MRRAIAIVVVAGCGFRGTGMTSTDDALGMTEIDAPVIAPTGHFAKTIEIHPTGADVDAFPVLVRLAADVDLAQHAQANGSDIVFVDDQGNGIPSEITAYAPTGALTAWVRVPHLSAASPTMIEMTYGGDPVARDPAAAWNAEFGGVYHFDDRMIATDSTSHHIDGAVFGATPAATAVIDGAYHFSGSGDYVNFGAVFGFPGRAPFTISMWTKPATTTPSGFSRLVARADVTPVGYSIEQNANDGHVYAHRVANGTQTYASTAVLSTTQYSYLCMTYDGGTLALSSDTGSSEASTDSNTMGAIISAFTVGAQLYGGNPGDSYHGEIDELHISTIARSAAWCAVEFANQRDPGAFYSVGPAHTSS